MYNENKYLLFSSRLNDYDKEKLNKKLTNPYKKDINLKLDFASLSYLPRWAVLFLDIFIVFLSLVVTFYLLLGLKLNFTRYNEYLVLLIFGFTNLSFFWVFKTYSGIIRHSSFVDAIKIFFFSICYCCNYYRCKHYFIIYK